MGDKARRDGPASADQLEAVFAHVGTLYRRVHRVVDEQARASGLTSGTRAVLERLLLDGPQTVPQLARTLSLSRQFVQRMVNEAGDHGLLEGAVNPAHRRSSLIALTSAGHRAISEVKHRERETMQVIAAELVSGEVAAALHVLAHLSDAFERSAPTAG